MSHTVEETGPGGAAGSGPGKRPELGESGCDQRVRADLSVGGKKRS